MNTSEHPPMPTLVELTEQLERSRADVAAGRTVSAESVLAELDASIRTMERTATDAA